MTEQISIMIDSSKQTVPETTGKERCLLHPKYKPKEGFGLAGGGYGVYLYCPICCKILSKTQVTE